MYADGRGVQQSNTEAAAWYRKAADQGDADAMGQLSLLAKYNEPADSNNQITHVLGSVIRAAR